MFNFSTFEAALILFLLICGVLSSIAGIVYGIVWIVRHISFV